MKLEAHTKTQSQTMDEDQPEQAVFVLQHTSHTKATTTTTSAAETTTTTADSSRNKNKYGTIVTVTPRLDV